MVRGFVARPAEDRSKLNLLEDLAAFVWKIVSVLLEKLIAHNLLITGEGVFIFPRKFHAYCQNPYLKTGFGDLMGAAICKSEEGFDKITTELYEKVFQEEVSLELTQFTELKDEILRSFKSK